MRLRLDEMVPRSIARELRDAGHDVDAVVEHPELRGLPDHEQFGRATSDGRAFVTYDTADYVPIAARRAAEGQEHPGLILLSAERLPQGSPAAVVKSLTMLLAGDGLGASFIHWAQ